MGVLPYCIICSSEVVHLSVPVPVLVPVPLHNSFPVLIKVASLSFFVQLITAFKVMSAEPSDLSKVDSGVSGLSSSPTETKGHRRASSSAAGVYNIADLGETDLHAVPKVKADNRKKRKARSCR